MHELSVANSIFEQVRNIANENNANAIKEIELEIGALSGIDKDSFSFVMGCIKESSEFNNCSIVYNYIENYFECSYCGKIISNALIGDNCTECHTGIMIIKGSADIKIKSILIE